MMDVTREEGQHAEDELAEGDDGKMSIENN